MFTDTGAYAICYTDALGNRRAYLILENLSGEGETFSLAKYEY